jgi:acetylornithine deacetylase/succinyl-diaminopimelate desuccinylase-like protein
VAVISKGIKTVIPSYAMAKLTFRLVPNQDPGRILTLVKQHLRKNLPPGVELEMEPSQTGPCYLTNPHSPNSDAAQRSLREVFGLDVALIRGGGSIPILSAFRDVLGAEDLLLGLGLPDSRIHSPNENFSIENLDAGIRLNQVLLRELAW